ncbi:MAG: ABC transporter substrate-binding protein, partial [Alphaproteobacteria bacterium]
EAIRHAVEANGGNCDVTGEMVRDGFYKIKDFTLDGLVPPIEITRKDHEGGGWIRVFKATKNGYVAETDWFRAYRDEVRELLEHETKK